MISATNATLQSSRIAQVARAIANHRSATYPERAVTEDTRSGNSRSRAFRGAVIHDLQSARVSRRTGSTEAVDAACSPAPASSLPPRASDDRAAKVQALKASIADGTYKPDAEAIARKLLKRGLQ